MQAGNGCRGLPPPTGRQADVVFMDPRGAVVVLGTAGSGKSLTAMHRAARLAGHQTAGSGPALLVTYNKALVAHLRHWAGQLSDAPTIVNFHKWARSAAAEAGLLDANHARFAQAERRDKIKDQAVAEAQARWPGQAVLQRPARFFSDELNWIAGMGCGDRAAYQEAERIGRGGGVNRGEPRAVVWDVY